MRGYLIAASFALATGAAAQTGDRVLDAQTELERAEKRRELGEEPRPGERTGTVGPRGGGSRLNDQYWERQRRLEGDEERARQRLERETERERRR